jgi:hypothetical protein
MYLWDALDVARDALSDSERARVSYNVAAEP